MLENPDLIKVLHGGSSDKIWLYRDFKIVLNNIFDTQDIYQAIGGRKLALNHIWEVFCGYQMDSETKTKYQTSNWSQRPLPKDMLAYASADSRYLIYLRYKLLMTALKGPDTVLKQKESYLKDKLTPKSLNKLYGKMQKHDILEKPKNDDFEKWLTKAAKSAEVAPNLDAITRFKKIYTLRDEYCRTHDLNPENLLSHDILFSLSTLSKVEKIPTSQKDKELQKHRENLYSKLSEICSEKLLETDRNNKDVQRVYRNLTSKANQSIEIKEKNKEKLQNKEKRRERVMERFSLKRPIYEGCTMLAPDGEILCKCDKDKINWYLERNLATIVTEDPLTIKLNFEPSGRGITNFNGEKDDDDFYVEHRDNICVSCGSDENLLRFQIVPGKFRIFFPEKFKSHRSHDVLLLCFNCNEFAIQKQAELEDKLSTEYDVPKKILAPDAQNKENVTYYQRIPRGIIRGKNKIPEERLQKMYLDFIHQSQEIIDMGCMKKEHEEQLKSDLETSKAAGHKIDFDILQRSLTYRAKKTTTVATKRQNLFGEQLIKKYGGEAKIPDFIRMWREFFLKILEPKYLPKNWSVDHSMVRVFGSKSAFYTEEKKED